MQPNSGNQDLTIILTLKDRVLFTYRWMQYMNDIACPYPIIIADGGVDLVLEKYLNDYGNYPKLNYTYIRYPFDVDLSAFYKKIVDVIDKVTTPYLLFADNDDFFLLEPISDFIKFLDENSDFVSCGGSNISLSLLSEENTVLNAAKAKNYIATSSNINRSVLMEDGVSRFCYFIENASKNELWNSWYQVHRTSCTKKAFAFLGIYQFKEILAYEIHIHLFLLLMGKYMEIKVPFYIRQNGTSQMSSEEEKQMNLVERFVKNNGFNEIHNSIENAGHVIDEVGKDKIYRAIAYWFAKSGEIIYSKNDNVSIRNVLRLITILVSKPFRRIFYPFKTQYHAFRRLSNRVGFHGNYKSLRIQIIEKYIQ